VAGFWLGGKRGAGDQAIVQGSTKKMCRRWR